jgi:spore maturation protein CgeB
LASVAEVTVCDPAFSASRFVDDRSQLGRIQRRLRARHAEDCFTEASRQLRPDVVLLIKGRGLGAEAVERVRSEGIPVALYYPDNPFWAIGDTPGMVRRLESVDLAIHWSERIANLLRPRVRRVEVLPFGYDHRWFPLTAPGGDRQGVVFLGTWSARRERFLQALEGLPLIVRGSLWAEQSTVAAGPPTYEATAGELLASAAIGLNLIHPQCSGAHNMRTREIVAAGALQITEPGTDGTPLRDGESCVWFRTPGELRTLVERYLVDLDRGAELARRAQVLTGEETYEQRGRQLAELLTTLSAGPVSLTRMAHR